MDCLPCPRGSGLSPECGTRLKYHNRKVVCEACELGKTYSAHEDVSSCEPCGTCAEHQTVVKNCTLFSDSQCNDTCSKGFYFESLTGDCQPCSWCCSDQSSQVRSGCKDMPFYKQCDVNTAKRCKPKCQIDQYVFPGSKGEWYCENCDVCPPGTSPFPECGSVVENTEQVICKSCIEGLTFSDNYGTSQCKPCTRCSVRQKEVLPCNLTNDRVCSDCDKGFYRDVNVDYGTSQCKPCTRCSVGQKEVLPCNLTNDRVCSDCDKGFYRDVSVTRECKPCSACCNDDKDVHIGKCAEQKMPKNFQCSQANRVGSVCQSESNKEPKFKSLVPVFIATSVTAGFVIVLLVSMYYCRLKFRRHKTITSHQSLALLLACEEGEKWSSCLCSLCNFVMLIMLAI